MAFAARPARAAGRLGALARPLAARPRVELRNAAAAVASTSRGLTSFSPALVLHTRSTQPGLLQRRCFSEGPHQVKTPALGGESITEGTMMEWKVKVGDTVKEGDIIATIETDKVTVDVNATASGQVSEILAPVEATVEVGQPVCVLVPGGTLPPPSASAGSQATAAPAGGSGEKIDVKCPDFGAESITEGTVMEWRFKVGDYVKQGEVLALIETDKITVEVKAEKGGTLTEIKLQADSTTEVGTPLCTMVLGDAPPAGAATAGAAAAAGAAAGAAAATAAASAAKAAPTAAAAAKPVAAAAAASAAPEAGNRGERREKMKRMRIAISKNLKTSQDTLAQLTTFQEVDMSGVMALRKEYKDVFFEAHGAKLGFMSMFIKASAFALQQLPAVNAYIDNAKDEIVYRDYIDIGFAAATPRGLVTPVIRNVESMSLKTIESSFSELAGKATKDKLSVDEITGSTFTISNGGVFGSMLGTPLVGSTEQAAVLGLHATKNRPVVLKNGEIGIRPIMYMALTYDHRLIDGREAVTFLCMVRDQVEDARRLLLEV